MCGQRQVQEREMDVLVVANNKGGVGKTTLSQIISTYMAERGHRTLAIDLDPQCNFSRRFLAMEVDAADPQAIIPPVHPDFDANNPDWAGSDGRGSSADIYRHGVTLSYPTQIPGLEIIPGESNELLLVERVTQQEVTRAVHKQLSSWLEDARIRDEFELVVLDTGPSKGPLTTSALYAATHILIPAEMEELSVEGLYGMLAYWSVNNLQRPSTNPLTLLGIVANKFDKRLPIHRHYYEALSADPGIGKYMLPVKMHYWQDYKEQAMHDAKSVLHLAAGNKTRQEAEALCMLLEERIYGQVGQQMGKPANQPASGKDREARGRGTPRGRGEPDANPARSDSA
jgi:chromosome partitioning protein